MKKRSKIFRNYINGSMLPDLLTTLIIGISIESKSSDDFAQFIKLIFLLRMKTLKCIYWRILEKFRIRSKVQEYFIDLANLLFISLWILHLFACFWFFVGVHSDPENNWIVANGLNESSTSIKYLTSLYWSAVTIM